MTALGLCLGSNFGRLYHQHPILEGRSYNEGDSRFLDQRAHLTMSVSRQPIQHETHGYILRLHIGRKLGVDHIRRRRGVGEPWLGRQLRVRVPRRGFGWTSFWLWLEAVWSVG